MNILFVTPYLPYPPVSGGRLQTFLRINYLKKRGHSVFLMTLARTGEYNYVVELKNYLDEVECIYREPDFTKVRYLFRKNLLHEIFTHDRRFGEKLRSFADSKKVDISLFEGLGVAQYRDFIPHVPSALYEHNVEYEITEQFVSNLRKSPLKVLKGKMDEKMRNCYLYLFGEREIKLVRKFEVNSLRKFGLFITCSQRDAHILERDTKETPHIVIPWCIEMPVEFNKPQEKDIYSLVFVGSMEWEPNRDAIKWFVKEIFPLIKKKIKNIKLLIVGSFMSEDVQRLDNKKDILVKGFVPDISEVFRETDIFIAPVRLGSGVNVKVLEAMSYGVPVITTSKGAEGIEALHGEHFLIVNTPEEFTDTIKYLLDNKETRKMLGMNAREYISKYHEADKVIELLENILYGYCRR